MKNPADTIAWDTKNAEENLLDALVSNYVDDDSKLANVDRIAEIDPELGECMKRYVSKLHLLRAFVTGLEAHDTTS